jgi:hypothetical protein
MAIHLGDEQLNTITKLQIIVDRTLRRLSRRRRELIRATDTGCLFSPSPLESGDNNGDEIEQPSSNQHCRPSGLVEQQPEREQLPEEEQQPKMVEDSEEHNLVTCDNSKEPEEESIKQGTGDLGACGPSTFFNVDSFMKIGEIKPFLLTCAAVNTVNTIDQNETEIKENVHGNVNESVQIDLSNEKIESSTDIDSVVAKIDSVLAKIDPVVVAEPVNAAEPADTGGTLMYLDSQDQSIINLCQTISCNSTTLNICFDSGATVTLVSEKVAEMSIHRKNISYELDTIGGQSSLKG